MGKIGIAIVIVVVLLALAALYAILGVRPAIKGDDSLSHVRMPQGFTIETFAEGLGGSAASTPGPNAGVRFMLVRGEDVYATIPSRGEVVVLRDTNGDGKSDSRIAFVSNLSSPHGIAYANGWTYIAEETRVVRVRDDDNDRVADPGTMETIIDGITTGRLLHGGHFTRTIVIRDGFLYFSAGSSCNVCEEESAWRAAITRCTLDGKECATYAKGLRNAVGLAFDPESGELYATENSRDMLGDDIPPDEINVIQAGGDYGWPICYGKNVHDTDFDTKTYVRNPCALPDKQPSLIDLQAHSAPLGIAFYTGTQFPSEYAGKAFVAYHGSWNRGEPTGYKVVTVDVHSGEVKDFATGWLQGSNVLGRPVDIAVASDGSLLVSDDNAGKIYRVRYAS